MKRHVHILLALLVISCSTEVVTVEDEVKTIHTTINTVRSGATFSSFSVEALSEDDPSEGDGFQFSWTTGDYIAVNHTVYKASNCSGQTAMFTPHTNDDEAPALESSPHYRAAYPHTITTTANHEGRNYLSSTVSYAEGQFGKLPLFAATDHDTLDFVCVTGALRLCLSAPEQSCTVSQIRIVANTEEGGNMALSDEFEVVEGTAVSTSSLVGALVMKPNKEVGVQEEAFGFPIIPGIYPKLTITVTSSDGTSLVLPFNNVRFTRASITTLHATLDYRTNENSNRIEYTSTDGDIVVPTVMTSPSVSSNTYADGRGVIILNKAITALQAKSFMDCATLATIVLPESINKIGNNSFQNCTALTSINLPQEITELGVNVFNGCPIPELSIPEKVSKIGNKALANNKAIKLLDIPGGVLLLDTNALLNDSSLETIIVNRYDPDDAGSPITVMNGKGVIQGCSSLKHIYVPAEAVEIYKAADGWSSKADIIEAK